jgi:hypothetical protein
MKVDEKIESNKSRTCKFTKMSFNLSSIASCLNEIDIKVQKYDITEKLKEHQATKNAMVVNKLHEKYPSVDLSILKEIYSTCISIHQSNVQKKGAVLETFVCDVLDYFFKCVAVVMFDETTYVLEDYELWRVVFYKLHDLIKHSTTGVIEPLLFTYIAPWLAWKSTTENVDWWDGRGINVDNVVFYFVWVNSIVLDVSSTGVFVDVACHHTLPSLFGEREVKTPDATE